MLPPHLSQTCPPSSLLPQTDWKVAWPSWTDRQTSNRQKGILTLNIGALLENSENLPAAAKSCSL